MTRSPVERLRALPFFTDEDYLSLNPDLRGVGVDAANHAFHHGIGEGRQVFRRAVLARAWGSAGDGPATPDGSGSSPIEAAMPSRVSVFVNTASDPADIALAADLVETLAASGITAALKDETETAEGDHGLPIVVAPHTYFDAGLGALWARTDVIERSLVFNTAPLHGRSFDRALPWILRCRGVMEASPQAAGAFEGSGLPAFALRFAVPLRRRWLEASDLAHPLVEALPGSARRLDFDARNWDDRPIDVCFFDRYSDRRSAFLRRQALTLAERPCFLYLAQGGLDALDDRVERRSHHRLAGHVGAHAKITIQLADDEFPHFDWHRCVTRSMSSGSVVVSDMHAVHPDRDIGESVFHDDVRHLGDLIRWLLDDADGRLAARSAREGAARAVERSDPGRSAALRSFLSEALGANRG